MRVAALGLLVLPFALPAPAAVAQPASVLRAVCVGGYANTTTEVAATADGTISRQRYSNSNGKGKGWQVLGRAPDQVERWVKSVDATEMRRARGSSTVERNPCKTGGSPACHIVRSKGNVDYYACSSQAVLKEMMDFNEWTAAPRATGALEVMSEWTRALAASDIEALVKLFAPDAILLADNSKTVVDGPAEIRKYLEELLRTKKPRVLDPTQQNTVLSENVVLVTQYNVWTNAPDGSTFPDRITFVLTRRDAGWLIVHFHSSATPQ